METPLQKIKKIKKVIAMVANVAAFGFAGLLSNLGTEVKKSFKHKSGKINIIWSSAAFTAGLDEGLGRHM